MSELEFSKGQWRQNPLICHKCGKTFYSRKKNAKYCSRACAWQNNRRRQHKREHWHVNSKGYIEGVCLVNGIWKRKKYHRRIMELHIGRELLPNEDVHHINGDKQDNRIENLMLISHEKHTSLTNKNRQYRKGYKMNLPNSETKRRSQWMSIVHQTKAMNNGLFDREIANQFLTKTKGEQ